MQTSWVCVLAHLLQLGFRELGVLPAQLHAVSGDRHAQQVAHQEVGGLVVQHALLRVQQAWVKGVG